MSEPLLGRGRRDRLQLAADELDAALDWLADLRATDEAAHALNEARRHLREARRRVRCEARPPKRDTAPAPTIGNRAMVTSSRVIDEIAAERRRQMTAEGWTPAHDDEHSAGQMAMAAACYAAPAQLFQVGARNEGHTITASDPWPWDPRWDKRDKHDRRRQLVIAAALICAEIERLDRAMREEVR